MAGYPGSNRSGRLLESMRIPRITASYTRAASATQYSAGDMIGDTTTAANATPITFQNAVRTQRGSGRVMGVSCVLAPASGNTVITALDFALWLFRPATDIPFAAGSYPGDNVAMAISAVAMRQCIGVFRFQADAWRGPAGAVAAGVAAYQSVGLAPVGSETARLYAPFDYSDLENQGVLGVMQALSAWNPGNVAQQFDFSLDIEGA